MQPVIYDVAVSIDGYIDGEGGDVSAFANEGPVVDDYQARLASYSCAIMGRATYEFGYRYGLEPGQNPYPHMETYVLSQTLEVSSGSDIQVLRAPVQEIIPNLKQQQSGPIYLCGGGQLAGSMMAMGLIDIVRLKRAPIILGRGTALFGDTDISLSLKCTDTKQYGDGYLLQEFNSLRL